MAWRVLDAQYWGVVQRRRRIYLVADLGGVTAPEILFKQDSLFGDTAPLQSAGQAPAAAAGAGVEDSGRRAVDIPAAFHINQREEVIDLGMVSGALMATANMQMQTFISSMAFAANQRDELRDLGVVSGALGARPGMKQQTFIAEVGSSSDGDADHPFAAGFCAGAAPTAGGIGYAEEISPTLKAGESGTNMVPSILCLNDQGGAQMACSEDVAGTLRAQEHGHQPLVMATQQGGAEIGAGICPTITSAAGTSGNNRPVLFENHGIDSRYTGPHGVAPTMSARYGTGFSEPPVHDKYLHD